MIETAIDYKTLYESAMTEIAGLRFELNNLKRLIFGSKTERFIPADNIPPSQLTLDIQTEPVSTGIVTTTTKVEYTKTTTVSSPAKVHPGRTALPEHLERKEIVTVSYTHLTLPTKRIV